MLSAPLLFFGKLHTKRRVAYAKYCPIRLVDIYKQPLALLTPLSLTLCLKYHCVDKVFVVHQ